MKPDKRIEFQELDQVLRNAQLRRSADLGLWLLQVIQRRRLAGQRREAERQQALSTRAARNLLAH
jgi:hypothetical protein